MIEDKAYNVVDKSSYFQVFWLQQMISQLAFLCDDQLNSKCMELCKYLYMQFKSTFIEDKFLELLESVFELDRSRV